MFKDERAVRRADLPGRDVEEAGREAAQPRRATARGARRSTRSRSKEYGRPLFLGASADLAESTNIAGFGKDFGDMPGWGWYERDTNLERHGAADSRSPSSPTPGSSSGIATVNLAADPFDDFNGFWGTCSTYGSFSLPQVRADAPVQPARPGLRAARSARCCGSPATPARRRPRTRARTSASSRRRHAALPGGPRHRPAPVGVQRGAGGAGRGAGDGRADRRAAPDAARRSRSRIARRWACRRTSRRRAAPT